MQNKFILLTAAKNEDQYIGEAIESVLRQNIHPLAWFIMDDGSTDRTGQIVRRFAAKHAFISLHPLSNASKRSFGSQYKAINAAYALARELDFDYIGIQDADIALAQNDYYGSILDRFKDNLRLGIAGGYVHEGSKGVWRCRKGNSPDSVAGGVQMFRRSCYEQIGGYTPLLFGGEDWLAQLDAKMAGWEVSAFPEFPVYHYRPTSSADGRLGGLLRLGMVDASFGSHPVFELLKCARRFAENPILISSIIRFAGYMWWKISGRAPLLSSDKVVYLRTEQLAKIWMWKRNLMGKFLIGRFESRHLQR